MMEPEDYTLTDSRGKTSVGIVDVGFVGEFVEVEDALQAVRDRMERDQFWPNIWWISDHGNFWQIDLEGKEVKTVEEDQDDWEAIVSCPGKFEGEAAYVPYFWDHYLNGFADDDDGEVLRFDVTDEDRRRFPDLGRVDFVKLRETDSGFVIEV